MTVQLKLPISQMRAMFYLIVNKSLSILTACKIGVIKPAYPCFNDALLPQAIS